MKLPKDPSRAQVGHQNHESGAQPLGIGKRQFQLAAEDIADADIGTAPDHNSQRLDRLQAVLEGADGRRRDRGIPLRRLDSTPAREP